MPTRFVRPLYARLGKGAKNHSPASTNDGALHMFPEPKSENTAGESALHPPPLKNLDGSTIKVLRDGVRGIQERRERSLSPPPRPHNGSIKVQRDEGMGLDERREPYFSLLSTSDTDCFQFQRQQADRSTPAEPSLSFPLKNSDPGSITVARAAKAGADEHDRAPFTPPSEPADRSESSLSPPSESSEDAAAKVRPNMKLMIEELEREPRFARTPARNRRNKEDDRVRAGTIIRVAAALIVLGLAFTALLPSALTRHTVAFAMTLLPWTSTGLAEPAQTTQVRAVEPVLAPRPSQPTEVVKPAPTQDDLASVAKTTPALRGGGAFEGQAQEEVLVPSAQNGAGRTPLTEAEKAAVMRGLQELERGTAVATPPRPAPTRPRLTGDEQAAVERGLRELEKTAGRASP